MAGESAQSYLLRGAVLWASVACATWVPSISAGAQDPYHCIDSLSDDAVSQRLERIDASFSRGKHKALGWRVGWVSGFLAMAGVQTVLAFDAHRDDEPWDRFAFAYQAAGSAALAVGLAVVPMPDVWGRKRIRQQPDSTPEERRDKLRYATRLFERGANLQGVLGSEALIGAAVMFGVAGGTAKAVKWTGKTPGNTALLFILPPIIGTGAMLSAPKNLHKDWEGYRGLACSEKYYDRGAEPVDIDLVVSPTGVKFSIEF
ncbi:MAG: hypothetical protein AAF436_03820 [Myxococcota bacterium]